VIVERQRGYEQFRRGVHKRTADADTSARTIISAKSSDVQWVLLGKLRPLSIGLCTDLGPMIHRLPLGLISSSRKAGVAFSDLFGYESMVAVHD
jgi:hypothetical protein